MRFSPPRNPDAKDAPVHCGARMVLRFARDGRGFYGCKAFPRCRYTEPANVREPDWFGKRGAK